jgi:hypothetical protein
MTSLAALWDTSPVQAGAQPIPRGNVPGDEPGQSPAPIDSQVAHEFILSFTHDSSGIICCRESLRPAGRWTFHTSLYEIRDRESRARGRLVGPGFIACASGIA